MNNQSIIINYNSKLHCKLQHGLLELDPADLDYSVSSPSLTCTGTVIIENCDEEQGDECLDLLDLSKLLLDDLLFYILQFFVSDSGIVDGDTLRSSMLVCKRWNHLACSPSMWAIPAGLSNRSSGVGGGNDNGASDNNDSTSRPTIIHSSLDIMEVLHYYTNSESGACATPRGSNIGVNNNDRVNNTSITTNHDNNNSNNSCDCNNDKLCSKHENHSSMVARERHVQSLIGFVNLGRPVIPTQQQQQPFQVCDDPHAHCNDGDSKGFSSLIDQPQHGETSNKENNDDANVDDTMLHNCTSTIGTNHSYDHVLLFRAKERASQKICIIAVAKDEVKMGDMLWEAYAGHFLHGDSFLTEAQGLQHGSPRGIRIWNGRFLRWYHEDSFPCSVSMQDMDGLKNEAVLSSRAPLSPNLFSSDSPGVTPRKCTSSSPSSVPSANFVTPKKQLDKFPMRQLFQQTRQKQQQRQLHQVSGSPTLLLHSDNKLSLPIRHFQKLELSSKRSNTVCQNGQHNVRMDYRATLVDWIIEIISCFDLQDSTAFRAMGYFDRFMLHSKRVGKRHYQLIAGACLYIAAKIETQNITVSDISFSADNIFNDRHVMQVEETILRTLDFKLAFPSIIDLLDEYIDVLQMSPSSRTGWMMRYISELTLQCPAYLSFVPSKIAACVVVLGLYTMNEPDIWSTTMEQNTGYQWHELEDCVMFICRYIDEIRSNLPQLSMIKRRYRKLARGCVSSIQIPRLSSFSVLTAVYRQRHHQQR